MLNYYKNLMNATFRDAQRRYLMQALAPFFPKEPSRILDIGSGNGEFASMLQGAFPHLAFTGLDVMDRGRSHVPVILYDGKHIPFEKASFDYVTFINMLHHTAEPKALLQEALRVSRKGVIIKDHYANNLLDYMTLLLMEYANPNSRALMQKCPLVFYTRAQWEALFSEIGLVCDGYASRFTSYGRGWDLLFGRRMHFIGLYRKP